LATDENIKLAILRKMLRLEYIGGKHTSIENLPKGFPKHERGRVMKIAHKMLKEGYFIVTQKPDGPHVSINPRVLSKIKYEIGQDW